MGILVDGKYQGIPILDGEWSMRAGVDPSRGWIRVLLSDLGGKLPVAGQVRLALKLWDRKDGKEEAKVQKNFVPEARKGPGSTVTGTDAGDAPGGFNGLLGPFGDLEFTTLEDKDSGLKATSTRKLKNILWTEAVIEQASEVSDEAVVRIELADERVTWGMGGYLHGQYNHTLNDIDETVSGNLLQWDPVLNNPTRVRDISEKIQEADASRPILDPKTIVDHKRPWLLSEMVIEACQQLPGPPKVELFSAEITKHVPFNLDYKGATPARDALRELLDEWSLVLVPVYGDGFQILDKGQAAGRGVENAIEKVGEIDGAFASEENRELSAVHDPLTPLAVEVVGERIIEEISCSAWKHVLKDEGSIEKDNGLLGKMGQWVPAQDLLSEWGYPIEVAVRSMLANWDKDASKMFDDVPPIPASKEDTENRAIHDARKRTLNQHFFKSFMVDGSFRRFLPMILERAEGASHALNFPNMGIQRRWIVFSDAWKPEKVRAPGIGSFFANEELVQVDAGDIHSVDQKKGVITFAHPMGRLAPISTFAFIDTNDNDLAFAATKKFDWDEKVGELNGLILGHLERAIENATPGATFEDNQFIIREAMDRFVRDNLAILRPETQKLLLDPKNIKLISGKVTPFLRERIGFTTGQNMTPELFNVAECAMVEPRILAIWAWERNYGRSDDWYRFRGGVAPWVPAYPLVVKGLRQYIAANGSTNKGVLDFLADREARKVATHTEEAIGGSILKFVGFHPVALSGQVPEVSFKFSLQDPPEAETVVHVNRFLHGTEGRPPAVATWSAHQRPVTRRQ